MSALEVNVLYTGESGTSMALAAAAQLSRGLGGTVHLIALQPVPYPLPIDCPPVSAEWLAEDIQRLAAAQSCPADYELVFCRNRRQTLLERLQPNSLLVLGGEPRWWRWERRLARAARRAGHEVLFAGTMQLEGERLATIT